MKLQSQVSRTYGKSKYLKRWIVIPFILLKELGWEDGVELEAEIKDKKLVIDLKIPKKN